MRDFIRMTQRGPDGKAYIKPLDPDCGACDPASEKCKDHIAMLYECLAQDEDFIEWVRAAAKATFGEGDQHGNDG